VHKTFDSDIYTQLILYLAASQCQLTIATLVWIAVQQMRFSIRHSCPEQSPSPQHLTNILSFKRHLRNFTLPAAVLDQVLVPFICHFYRAMLRRAPLYCNVCLSVYSWR